MDVKFTQFVAHGTGGNFSRWLDETNFRFQQTVSPLGDDLYDAMIVDLMMPGPQGEFGPPSVSCKCSPKKKEIKAVLCLDPATYGVAKTSDVRIRLLIEGLADLTKALCVQLGREDLAEDFWMRVFLLQDEIVPRSR